MFIDNIMDRTPPGCREWCQGVKGTISQWGRWWWWAPGGPPAPLRAWWIRNQWCHSHVTSRWFSTFWPRLLLHCHCNSDTKKDKLTTVVIWFQVWMSNVIKGSSQIKNQLCFRFRCHDLLSQSERLRGADKRGGERVFCRDLFIYLDLFVFILFLCKIWRFINDFALWSAVMRILCPVNIKVENFKGFEPKMLMDSGPTTSQPGD